MLFLLFSIFLFYVGLTLLLRLFISCIAASGLLSHGSKIFFNAFFPIVFFASALLLFIPDTSPGGMLFIAAMLLSRVVILFFDGNQYLEAMIINDETVEIVYRNDFLQQKTWTISLYAIRSVKLDHAERVIDFPGRFQLLLKNGNTAKLLIVDRKELEQHYGAIEELLRRLDFTERQV